MAPAQPQISKLLTRDLAAYSDAELNEYLEANGGIVDVQDYENLRKDEILIQPLRIRSHARGLAQSRPIDLDNLTARLEDVSADRQALPRSPSTVSTEPYDEEEMWCYHLGQQTEYYNILVNEGGRPSHPASLSRDIIENPGEYREILSYWQSGDNDWKVFGCQMERWRRFRGYQQYTRQEGRFTRHYKRAQKRLTRHGFEQPFDLNKDLDQQDKLGIWIEFLNFEYQDYDKDMRFVQRHQPEYDEAWKELLDSQVLRPSETEEFICSIDSVFQRASEKDGAGKAVKSAQAAVISAQKAIIDPRRSNPSEPEAQQNLAEAQSRLDAAVKLLESITRRNDLVYEFLKKTKLSQATNDGKLKKTYEGAKQNAERRSILLRWILQQVPLVKLELNQVAENNLDRVAGRSCDQADKLSEEQSPKKQKRKLSHHEDIIDDELSSKRPRLIGRSSSFSAHKRTNTIPS